MSRFSINRSAEMDVFVQVVEQGGFSQAARRCGLTPSAISKLITRLESRLNARLFNRSTRRLELTAEGCVFYEKSIVILADIAEAEQQACQGQRPIGRVRLNTSASYATHILAPILPEFLKQYPDVSLDIAQSDIVIDLLADRSDVAVRAGALKDSNLMARKLGASDLTIVGAPSYFERFGTPMTLEDLEHHHRLSFGYPREIDGWRLFGDDGPMTVSPPTRLLANDGEAMRQMALAGAGLARLTSFTVREDIKAGRLIPVLKHLVPAEPESFHAVFLGQGGPAPARVRALLDFLAEHGRVS